MTKPRISNPEHLAEADRILRLTADRRAEIACEQAERDIDEVEAWGTAEHVRRTGLTPPAVDGPPSEVSP